MFGRDYQFWMKGVHASGLAEVSSDPEVLNDGRFWAVVASFEGEYRFARFRKVRMQPFPESSWQRLERPWISTQEEIDYISYIHAIREAISAGTVYQVNACRELQHYLGDKPLHTRQLLIDLQGL